MDIRKVDPNSIPPSVTPLPEGENKNVDRPSSSANDKALKEIWSAVENRFKDYLDKIGNKS